MPKDYCVSELSSVRLYFVHSFKNEDIKVQNITTYIVPTEHVDRFVTAQVRLHHTPGINPHNYSNTTKIREITVSVLQTGSQGLNRMLGGGFRRGENVVIGANVIQGYLFKQVWIAPEYERYLSRAKSHPDY